ncbi:MAG: hypothetical protein LBT05_11055 [Planctomycetaceae bacterium]|jgi:hypothetical protein|nr:hypothetical protein [Planctomycetaceae bacterium]
MTRQLFNVFRKTALETILLCIAGISVSAQESAQVPVETIDQIRTLFQQPGRDYSTGPLWTWNDLLTEEQVRSTMQDMAAQHVKQVWVHPRPGLMTPYLSDDWFRLWGIALDEAEKLDMNVWIYDENSYPSGFAGGFVPETMPDSRGKGLHLQRVKELAAVDDTVWYVYKITKNEAGAETFENVTAWAKEQKQLPAGDWLIGKIQLAGTGGWFGGWWYVDLLKQGVTEKFIEITLEPYRKRFGEQFGKRLPGWFTDEPHLQAAGGLTWNEEIPQLFEKKFGYSLIDNLPSLTAEVGDWKKVRHNYQQILLDLFIERWAKPCHDYCEKYGLQFTGHYWEHGWPGAGHGPDNMAMYAWHQRPAIDILMNQYNEGVNAQFGNARSVKELASVANQMGYKRTLSETYGAGGWDLRFEDMKRIADWQYALGVNTTNEHLSYVTIRGARKRDHPQSFSYHASWWEAYRFMADYHTRLSYALTRGEQINRVLVIEPTTTAWMYQGNPHLSQIGGEFQNFVNLLERWQAEYDLGSEDVIARWGKVEDGRFVVNKRAYDLVILPPNMENINEKTLELLTAYVQAKGSLICCSYPDRVDGIANADVKQTLGGENANDIDTMTAAWSALSLTYKSGFRYNAYGFPVMEGTKLIFETYSKEQREANSIGKVFHHRRQVSGGEILFLCNTDINSRAIGKVNSAAKSAEQWSPETGAVSPYPYESGGDRISFNVDLPPCGSLLLFLSAEAPKEKAVVPSNAIQKVYQPLGEPKVKRLKPNVLTIDYVDVNIGGEVRNNQYTYEANKWIWQKHGFAKNPWDNEVQFKDRLITKTFPQDSGFSATYKFTLTGQIPYPLHIVIERPDLYAITCNGKQVSAKPGDWRFDKAFGKVDISSAAQLGVNEVTITAKPMTMYHELEPAYLIGDFSVEPAEKGFEVKASKPLYLVPPANVEDAHSVAIEGVAWLTSGVGFAPENKLADDLAPYLIFDLGETRVVESVKIWNYNEANMKKRGVASLKIYVANKPDITAEATTRETFQQARRKYRERGGNINEFTYPEKKQLLGEYPLTPGSSNGPQTIQFNPPRQRLFDRDDRRCRYLIFEIVSNHNGVKYPIPAPAEGSEPQKFDDNAFVGLSEVKIFYESVGGRVYEAKTPVITKVSSELTVQSFDRAAKHLVDGSGLIRPERGWNRQGMPFYPDGVAYTERFDFGPNAAKNAKSRYFVTLNKWYGVVAKVAVNGKDAGYIGFAPWQCDVTEWAKPGVNEITVTVIGAPKNLLGPHHSGAMRGTAWPSAFWKAPQDGPPPGSDYDVIGYGLFEAFTVVEK